MYPDAAQQGYTERALSTRPTYLKFYLERIDDDELVCFFCGLPKCEQSFTVSGAGQRKVVGAHDTCSDKHMDKLTARPKRDTNV